MILQSILNKVNHYMALLMILHLHNIQMCLLQKLHLKRHCLLLLRHATTQMRFVSEQLDILSALTLRVTMISLVQRVVMEQDATSSVT